MFGKLKKLVRKSKGMEALQAVLLVGAGFLIVWGLMALWDGAKPPLQAHVHRILGVEARANLAPGDVRTGGGGRAGGGGSGRLLGGPGAVIRARRLPTSTIPGVAVQADGRIVLVFRT